jgi:Flp pilus assembly protein TadB
LTDDRLDGSRTGRTETDIQDMRRKLTMRERWQWLVALAALVVVIYLLLPLWVTVVAIAFVLAFAVPSLIHSRRRRRVRR